MLIVGLPWAGLLWNLRGDSRITFSPIDSYAFRFSWKEAAQGVLAEEQVKATLSDWFAEKGYRKELLQMSESDFCGRKIRCGVLGGPSWPRGRCLERERPRLELPSQGERAI